MQTWQGDGYHLQHEGFQPQVFACASEYIWDDAGAAAPRGWRVAEAASVISKKDSPIPMQVLASHWRDLQRCKTTSTFSSHECSYEGLWSVDVDLQRVMVALQVTVISTQILASPFADGKLASCSDVRRSAYDGTM